MSRLNELISELCPKGVKYLSLEKVTSAINIGINPRKFFKLNPDDATGFYVTVRELNGLEGVRQYEKTDTINDEAIKIIENLTREPVVGEIYPVRVVKIVDFGAFVELWPGCEGLVHISELDTKRVAKVEDVVHVDDEIVVKLLKIDDKGKLVLSRKVLLKQTQKTENEEKTQALHEVEQKGE